MIRHLPIIDVTRRRGPGRAVREWPTPTPRATFRQEIEATLERVRGGRVEGDPFNILILNYTMACPLACDYCCYGCHPGRTETMDLELALSLVDQAAELGVFAECGFTGGEPLAYLDDVLTITARMKLRGLPFSMISACDWAADDVEVRRRIDPLVANGMSVFTVSHDPSHEKWVDRDKVRRAVRRVLELGVRVVICGSFYDDTTDLPAMFPEFTGRSDVDFVSRVVLPGIGRAGRKDIAAEDYPHVAVGGGGTCYKRYYNDVTVFWDGEVYPCCSVYNRATPGLSMGNVYDLPLAKVWDRIAGSALLRTLKQDGVPELLAELRAGAPELADRLPDEAEAIGPCHLCHQLLAAPEIAARAWELYTAKEEDRVHHLVSAVLREQGEQRTAQLLAGMLSD